MPGMVRFTLLGVPVSIHPSLWVMLAMLGGVFCVGSVSQLFPVCLFVLAAFASLLVHEMGHALVGRHLGGGQPEISLAWLGGDCCNSTAVLTRWQGVVMTAAGPVASLLLGVATTFLLAVKLGSLKAGLLLAAYLTVGQLPEMGLDMFPPLALMLYAYLIQVSVWWSLLNLLPIFPLDGGQIMNGLMRSTRLMHSISMVVALILALCFFSLQMLLMALLMGMLAFINYKGCQQSPY